MTGEASLSFFGPVALAYLAICGALLMLSRWPAFGWPRPIELHSDRPALDFALAVTAVVGIFALGEAYRRNLLLPDGAQVALREFAWTLNNCIIFSPIALTLLVRGQRPETVFLSLRGIGVKVLFGLTASIAAVVLYLLLRGRLEIAPDILLRSFEARSLQNFAPVFLEGVAVAFLFVRLKWLVGLWETIVAVAVLFAAAHVPRSIAGGADVEHVALFFAFNVALPVAILYSVQRVQDVIWIGFPHYFMDVAIGAFE
jgi:hypothetical protein